MFNFDLSGKNKYYNLYLGIRGEILRGKLAQGERLPSKRVLAEELGVSVMTIQLAYDQLLAEGYIVSKERSGYFVADAAFPRTSKPQERRETPENLPPRYKIDFTKGSAPAELFPFATWARLSRKVLSDCGEHLLERVPCEGDSELKRAISAYLYRARGMDVDPRYIIVGAGAEYLYGVIVQLLGRDKVFAVENPGYARISQAYALSGAKVVPVDVERGGISVDGVEKSNATIAHISPSHQFPTGAVTSVSQRLRLISCLRDRDGYIIEDDYDSEFRLYGKPLQSAYSLCPERVIYINTFSKSLAPSMRMGYTVLPPALYERFLKLFSSSANTVPLFEQKTLALMLDGGYFERHVARLKNYYRQLRPLALSVLDELNMEYELCDEGGGVHVIAKFPYDDSEIKRRAEECGIGLKCLSDYAIAPREGLNGCAVINFSGVTLSQLKK